MTPKPTLLNRKERKERKEDPFVRDTLKVLCDVFAFLAGFAVQSNIQDLDRSTLSG
jgi:hypothetical protein